VSIKSFPDYKHLLRENYLDMLELYTLWTGDADLRLYITTVQDG